jgi:PAS domain S-box-containing protein
VGSRVIYNVDGSISVDGAIRRLKDITGLSADLIWEADKDRKLVLLSENAVEHLGRSWSEFIGMTINEIIQPAEPGSPEVWPDSLHGFRNKNFSYQHPDGTERLFQISAVPIYTDDKDEFLGVRGIARDITKLAAQEKELTAYREHLEKLVEIRTSDLEQANQEKSEAIRKLETQTEELEASQNSLDEISEQLESAIQSFSDGFVLFDSDDNFVLANDFYFQAYPKAKEIFIYGDSFETLVRKLDAFGVYGLETLDPEVRIQNRMAVYRAGGSYEYRTSDGLWYQMNQYKTRSGGTSLVRTDITDIKRSELKARFRGEIIDDLNEGVSVSRMDNGTFIYSNPKFCTMFGYETDEIKSQHISVLHVNTNKTSRGIIRRISDAVCSEGSWSGEVLSRKKNGTSVWCAVTVSAFEHPDFGSTAISIYRDITARKELEEQLQRAHRLEALGQLTGGVAHDFNNLLSIINGNAELLEIKAGKDEAIAANTRSIKNAVERGASLTNRLLSFSRSQPLAPVSADVEELVGNLVEILRRTLGSTIELQVKNGIATAPAKVDPHQFEDALLNLALNARDAMPNGGTLKIETANVTLDQDFVRNLNDVDPGNYIKVSVSDDGIGMTGEVMGKVFEPFFTTKDVGDGSGLGLSMVYGFAQQSRGHVDIYSEVNKGTKVELYLPRHQPEINQEVP